MKFDTEISAINFQTEPRYPYTVWWMFNRWRAIAIVVKALKRNIKKKKIYQLSILSACLKMIPELAKRFGIDSERIIR